jgi:hypothetical protein
MMRVPILIRFNDGTVVAFDLDQQAIEDQQFHRWLNRLSNRIYCNIAAVLIGGAS